MEAGVWAPRLVIFEVVESWDDIAVGWRANLGSFEFDSDVGEERSECRVESRHCVPGAVDEQNSISFQVGKKRRKTNTVKLTKTLCKSSSINLVPNLAPLPSLPYLAIIIHGDSIPFS